MGRSYARYASRAAYAYRLGLLALFLVDLVRLAVAAAFRLGLAFLHRPPEQTRFNSRSESTQMLMTGETRATQTGLRCWIMHPIIEDLEATGGRPAPQKRDGDAVALMQPVCLAGHPG